MFPKIYNSIYEKIYDYEDEDMMFRFKVISHIPFFKGLSNETIWQLIFLIEEQINL